METKENYNEHKKGEPHMDKRGNISSRNMRLFAAIMTLIEALVLTSLTGCSGKKVDYGNESEIKETKNMSVLADIRADSGWNENFTIQTGNGEKTVYVNANIVVPDCDNMSVVEVENIKIDVDYKKRFLDLYFGGNEYYYHDPDHYTVDELNEIIEDWQKTQDETYSEELEQRLLNTGISLKRQRLLIPWQRISKTVKYLQATKVMCSVRWTLRLTKYMLTPCISPGQIMVHHL